MKLSKKQHLIYDILISSLALTAVVLVIIDLTDELKAWQRMLDYSILLIFTADYFLRLGFSESKWKFIRQNICDLVAIIPFHTIFRLFKLANLTKLVKLPRLFAFLYRPFRKAKRFFNTNGFKYVLFVTALLIMIGGILIHFAEGMSLPDGIWWAFVTATTVGYGDISPITLYGRLIATVLMLVGIGLIGTVTSTITSYFLKPIDKSIKSETLENIKRRLDQITDLTDEDIDTIGKILKTLNK